MLTTVSSSYERFFKAENILKIRKVIKLIENDSWFQVKVTGSHRQYKHPTKRGRVAIAGHFNHHLAHKTLKNIFKQAQLEDMDD